MSHIHNAAGDSRRRVRRIRLAGASVVAVAAAALVVLFIPADPPAASPAVLEQAHLRVAVVPAADSAGFFVALHQGLFAAKGLHVTFVPAISSETVINSQALGGPHPVDISCGNYVSYIQAQENYDRGERPDSLTGAGVVAADLDIFAEGSVMTAGAQGLYVLPGSHVRTLAGLKGLTVGVNVPDGVLYLLVASVLSEDGVPVSKVRFAYYPLPQMAAMLKAGKVAGAVLPEPFASQAELSLGVVPLADLDQGATNAFPVQGCAVTKTWAALHPVTLAAFRAALEHGQQLADTSRSAVEQAMEALPASLGLTAVQAAVMALDSYPVGPVDRVRVQRVADVMHQFLGFPSFNVGTMIGGL
jgi:NitT/TauT family transport system substrate-binding protein